MNVIQPSQIKRRAAGILEQTRPDYRRTVVFHSGISLAALVIVMLLDLLLSNAVAQTGGLSGIGTRSVLETVQSVLSTAVNILLPFWEIGILYTTIRVVRRQPQEYSMLTRGFHRVGPVVRYYLVLVAALFGVAMVCSNITMMLAMFVPIPDSLETAFSQIDITAIQDPEQLMEMLPVDQLLSYMLPALIVFALVYCGILIHLSYRFRVSQYLLVDEEKVGAVAALALSNRLTKGNRWNLFKLDLSFWWYYVLQLLIAAVAYGPELLSLAGVTLPISSSVAGFLFYLLYAVLTLALSWWAGAYVQASYACAYEQLRTPPEDYPYIEA